MDKYPKSANGVRVLIGTVIESGVKDNMGFWDDKKSLTERQLDSTDDLDLAISTLEQELYLMNIYVGQQKYELKKLKKFREMRDRERESEK